MIVTTPIIVMHEGDNYYIAGHDSDTGSVFLRALYHNTNIWLHRESPKWEAMTVLGGGDNLLMPTLPEPKEDDDA